MIALWLLSLAVVSVQVAMQRCSWRSYCPWARWLLSLRYFFLVAMLSLAHALCPSSGFSQAHCLHRRQNQAAASFVRLPSNDLETALN